MVNPERTPDSRANNWINYVKNVPQYFTDSSRIKLSATDHPGLEQAYLSIIEISDFTENYRLTKITPLELGENSIKIADEILEKNSLSDDIKAELTNERDNLAKLVNRVKSTFDVNPYYQKTD
ncbi:MAG: hypothetical protein ACP5N3_05410 [Candidatus Nanoarchaeia archaeon]